MYRNHDLNVANRRAHETNDRCCMKQSNRTSDIFIKNHNFMRGRGIDYMKGLNPNSKFSFVKQHFNKLQKELAGIAYERGMIKREPINKYASNVPSFKGGFSRDFWCSGYKGKKPSTCFDSYKEYKEYSDSFGKSGKGYVDSDGFQYFYADDPRAYDYRMFE
jgi:hypothetical protein